MFLVKMSTTIYLLCILIVIRGEDGDSSSDDDNDMATLEDESSTVTEDPMNLSSPDSNTENPETNPTTAWEMTSKDWPEIENDSENQETHSTTGSPKMTTEELIIEETSSITQYPGDWQNESPTPDTTTQLLSTTMSSSDTSLEDTTQYTHTNVATSQAPPTSSQPADEWTETTSQPTAETEETSFGTTITWKSTTEPWTETTWQPTTKTEEATYGTSTTESTTEPWTESTSQATTEAEKTTTPPTITEAEKTTTSPPTTTEAEKTTTLPPTTTEMPTTTKEPIDPMEQLRDYLFDEGLNRIGVCLDPHSVERNAINKMGECIGSIINKHAFSVWKDIHIEISTKKYYQTSCNNNRFGGTSRRVYKIMKEMPDLEDLIMEKMKTWLKNICDREKCFGISSTTCTRSFVDCNFVRSQLEMEALKEISSIVQTSCEYLKQKIMEKCRYSRYTMICIPYSQSESRYVPRPRCITK